jgi:hypothetical protein
MGGRRGAVVIAETTMLALAVIGGVWVWSHYRFRRTRIKTERARDVRFEELGTRLAHIEADVGLQRGAFEERFTRNETAVQSALESLSRHENKITNYETARALKRS